MKVCNNCGTKLIGNYCSNCGVAARPGQKEISSVFLKGSELEKAIGFFSVLKQIASSPIKNTLSFASSNEFNQKAFLLKCISVYAAVGLLSKIQITNDLVASILSTGGMFAAVFVQVVLTYYGFRVLSSTFRSGGDYARLICVAQGIAFLTLGIVELLGLTLGFAAYALAMLGQNIFLVPYWALVLGRFWNRNPIIAYLIYIISMLPAAVVIFLIFPVFEKFISF